MELEYCETCGGDAVPGSTCPRAIACPYCFAGAGCPCKRPSGHEADVLHAARWQRAEELDSANGIRYDTSSELAQLELSTEEA